jgi:hypothetical protein
MRFNFQRGREAALDAEEVILVLSLYFEHGQLPASDPRVVGVSRVMSALPVNVNVDHAGTVRQPGAVAMKLANFAYADNPRGGLRNVGPRDRRFFDTYKDRRGDCRRRAQAIRRSVARARRIRPNPRSHRGGPTPPVLKTDAEVSGTAGARPAPGATPTSSRRGRTPAGRRRMAFPWRGKE